MLTNQNRKTIRFAQKNLGFRVSLLSCLIKMGASSSSFGDFETGDSVLEKAAEILAEFPENRAVKYLLALKEDGTLESMSDEDLQKLFKCVKTGLENKDSGLGCYAMEPADYDQFAAFFDKVRLAVHPTLAFVFFSIGVKMPHL